MVLQFTLVSLLLYFVFHVLFSSPCQGLRFANFLLFLFYFLFPSFFEIEGWRSEGVMEEEVFMGGIRWRRCVFQHRYGPVSVIVHLASADSWQSSALMTLMRILDAADVYRRRRRNPPDLI